MDKSNVPRFYWPTPTCHKLRRISFEWLEIFPVAFC